MAAQFPGVKLGTQGTLPLFCSFVWPLDSSWSGLTAVLSPTSCLELFPGTLAPPNPPREPSHPLPAQCLLFHWAFLVTTPWDLLSSGMPLLLPYVLWHEGYLGGTLKVPGDPLSLVHGTHGTQT